MRTPWLRGFLSGVLVVGSAASASWAQGGDSRRAQATRTELEAQLQDIEKVLTSPGYSGRLRAAKRAEGELLRQRLQEGDFQVGDQIILSITGDTSLSGVFSVATGRVLLLANIPPIPLNGVLRSEVQGYLTEQLKRYIRDPEVRAQSLIRLSVFGAVSKPGFLHVPADALAGDAIMAAGGPAQHADPHKTVVRRGGAEILTRETFQEAIAQGRTLDQLNLRAGDEIFIGERSRRIDLPTVLGITSALVGIAFLAVQVF